MEIKIKNGLSTNLDKAGVVKGELKFTTDTDRLYVGNGSANVEIPNATDLAEKQDKLPNASEVGQVLTASTTAGDVTWTTPLTISVSATGTSTTVINYITINGVEYKLAGSSNWDYDPTTGELTFLNEATYSSTDGSLDFGETTQDTYDSSTKTLALS